MTCVSTILLAQQQLSPRRAQSTEMHVMTGVMPQVAVEDDDALGHRREPPHLWVDLPLRVLTERVLDATKIDQHGLSLPLLLVTVFNGWCARASAL